MQPILVLASVMGGREDVAETMEQALQKRQPIPADDVEALFAAYADMVYRIAFLRTKSGADADDVTQDVFLRCMKRKPVWNDREHQKAWFLTVTINCTKTLLTSAWRRHTVPEVDGVLHMMEHDTDVYAAVLALPEKYRTAVHLHYYEGYDMQEIAKLMQSNPNTVKSYLFRARGLLREQLKGEYFDV